MRAYKVYEDPKMSAGISWREENSRPPRESLKYLSAAQDLRPYAVLCRELGPAVTCAAWSTSSTPARRFSMAQRGEEKIQDSEISKVLGTENFQLGKLIPNTHPHYLPP